MRSITESKAQQKIKRINNTSRITGNQDYFCLPVLKLNGFYKRLQFPFGFFFVCLFVFDAHFPPPMLDESEQWEKPDGSKARI